MEIEWDRSYTSTVRRGKLVRLFEAKGLLSKFVSQSWLSGAYPRGESEKRFCLRIADEYDAYLRGAPISDDGAPDETVALQFALEAHLRDFLVKNLDHLEPGLRLYVADDRKGVEFPVDSGRIDILATDKDRQVRCCRAEARARPE